MALLWVTRTAIFAGQTSTGLVGGLVEVYQNSRETSGNLTLTQKVVVVASYMMVITDTSDLFRLRLVVADEGVTPTVSVPEDADPEIKGLYPFAMGPVYFAPRRKIAVPSESTFNVVIEKVLGSQSTGGSAHFRFLLNTSFAG